MDRGEVEGEGILTKRGLFFFFVCVMLIVFFVNNFVNCLHLVAGIALRYADGRFFVFVLSRSYSTRSDRK